MSLSFEEPSEKKSPQLPASSPFPRQFGPACPEADDEIDLFECWQVIWGGRKFVAFFTGVCTLLAALVSIFVLPVTYRSTAVLQPVAADQGDFSKMNALNGVFSSMLGTEAGDSKSQQLEVFLLSSNLKQRLIEKYELLPHFYRDSWDAKQNRWDVASENRPTVIKTLQTKRLDDFFTVSRDEKTGLITLAWVDRDAAFAARMLERIIQELSHYLEFEYETDAQRERVFIGGQLEKAKADLRSWEERIPDAKLTQGAIQRELVASQLVYQELRKQLELAKIQEAKQVVSFKVLDKPFIPEIKYQPKRALICAATLMAAGFLSIIILFVRRGYRNLKASRG